MSGAAPSTFKRCSGARNPLGDSHLRPSALSVVGADQPGSSSSSFLAERPQEPVARPTRLPPRTARRTGAVTCLSPVSVTGLTTGLTVTDLTDRRHVASMGYCRSMGEPIRIPAEPLAEEAPPEAAAAIRRGLDDVEAGRVTPIEEVRKLIPKWTARSSSPTRP